MLVAWALSHAVVHTGSWADGVPMPTHQGGIDVQSAPGPGSRFTLFFPVAGEPAQPAPAEVPAALGLAPG